MVNINYEAERRTNIRIQEKNPSEKTHRTSGWCLGFSIIFASTRLCISQLTNIVFRHDPDDCPATNSDTLSYNTQDRQCPVYINAGFRRGRSRKAMSIKCCVCVCSCSYSACKVPATHYIAICGLSGSTIRLHIISKTEIFFGKKVIGHKMVMILSTNFV